MKTEYPSYRKEIAEFEQSVGQLREQLVRTAKGFLHDADLAEDAVQETLMRCWIVRDRLGNIGELPAFAQALPVPGGDLGGKGSEGKQQEGGQGPGAEGRDPFHINRFPAEQA